MFFGSNVSFLVYISISTFFEVELWVGNVCPVFPEHNVQLSFEPQSLLEFVCFNDLPQNFHGTSLASLLIKCIITGFKS